MPAVAEIVRRFWERHWQAQGLPLRSADWRAGAHKAQYLTDWRAQAQGMPLPFFAWSAMAPLLAEG